MSRRNPYWGEAPAWTRPVALPGETEAQMRAAYERAYDDLSRERPLLPAATPPAEAPARPPAVDDEAAA